jgi:hypothetical protein
MVESNQADARLGIVSGAGDVNGDGYDDVIIGTPNYLAGFYFGVAFVYSGGASGISESPGAKVQSDQSGSNLGNNVSGAGDVDNDGFADVILAASAYDHDQKDEGVAFIYHGRGCYSIDSCDGDFDGDNDVDGSDLAVFAADFGRTDCDGDCKGDFDKDGDCDGTDLSVFAADFGRTDCH